MAGEAYQQRHSGGFIDNDNSRPADSQYHNAVETALRRLLGADPVDKATQVWDTALGRMKSVLIKNENIDPAAAIDKSKLAPLNITDADVSAGAAISASKISGLTGFTMPAGVVVDYAGSSAPSGWLICDGSAVSRATYASLFSAIGTTHGAGDGSTTFNLPDYRGRVPVGVGTHADVATLGANDGLAVGSRRPKHKHTVGAISHSLTLPDHTHNVTAGRDGGSPNAYGSGGFAVNNQTFASAGVNSTPAINGSITAPTVGPQTGSEPTDSAAYIVVNKIVKT